jgi:hypothetical protein
MGKLALAKTLVFYTSFTAFISLPAVYDVFILNQMDRKFHNSRWEALEVYALGSVWIWFNLALAFLILAWLSNELTKLDISYLGSIGTAFLTALVCYLYTGNKATAWELSLKPDYVGIIAIAVIFSILNFLTGKN